MITYRLRTSMGSTSKYGLSISMFAYRSKALLADCFPACQTYNNTNKTIKIIIYLPLKWQFDQLSIHFDRHCMYNNNWFNNSITTDSIKFFFVKTCKLLKCMEETLLKWTFISLRFINVNFPFSLVNQQTASPYLRGRHTQRKLFNLVVLIFLH